MQQVSGWLREKGYGEVDLTDSKFERLPNGAELVVTHGLNKRGHSVRVRLTETDARGKQWLTSIAMHSPSRDAGWLSVRVAHSGGKSAETPKVARYLMEVLDLRDSGYRVAPGAPVIRPDGVDDLLEAVCDPDRNGLLFVAGTDTAGVDLFAPFTEKVERWARRIHGVAQFVVLDPAATAAFNDGIGATHATPPWAIRSYAPGADPAWEPDARRHRILGTRRLANEDDRDISQIIFRAARRHAASHKLPDAARSVLKDLNRIEDRALLNSLFTAPEETPAPTPRPSTPVPLETVVDAAEQIVAETEEALAQAIPTAHDDSGATPPDALSEDANETSIDDTGSTEHAADLPDSQTTTGTNEATPEVTLPDVAAHVAEYLATIEMAKQALGVDDLNADMLRQIADAASRAKEQAAAREALADRVSRELIERQEQIDDLEDRMNEATTTADDAVLEQRLAEDARRNAEDEVRWLRGLLDKQGRHEEAWAPLPDTEVTKVPDNFETLLDRLEELEGVVFTGDRRTTLGLDDQDTMGNIVSAAWECLLVLVDYAAAKASGDYTGNMKQYLLNTPSGYRTVPKKRFGEKEASSTLDQWANDRAFPVSREVDEDGRILMEAHFKLPHCGMVTPRIHYYDHTHASGKIYVGYIGPHLRTKGTN